jgi:hypothetical protein
MEKNDGFERELEPISVSSEDFWRVVVGRLLENSKKVQPVYLESPEFGKIGDFFISLIEEDGKHFVQAGDFSSLSIDEAFISVCTSKWVQLQPGIYRLEI